MINWPNWLLLLSLPICLSCQSHEDHRAFAIGHRVIAGEKYGAMLPAINQVDLFAFSDSNLARHEQFRLSYARSESFTVTNHVTLQGTDAERFAEMWRNLRFTWSSSLCFEPAFGIRFSNDRRLVFETAVCLHCVGYTAPLKKGYAVVGFSGNSTNFLLFSNALVQSFSSTR